MDLMATRDALARAFTALGTPSRAKSGYFRFQRKVEHSSVTTVAVYCDDAGAHAVEIAFNIEAIASAVNDDAPRLLAWVEARREATGRAVRENPRYGYARVGIGSKYELSALIDSWRELTAPAAAATPRPALTTDRFISVPFYIEGNGSKTFFAPALRHPKGYQVGRKGEERYILEYWEALAYLKGMASPAFRRPNGNGNRSIVTCQPGDAEDVSLKYLQDQLARTQTTGGDRD
ncbi:hypothetical protein AWB78_05832 [Caballeronia calidae]|uniref:Uncharacterized protein n=1 Tax=Caballeronia calidae TaxID=1777139 RepID=A0A158DYX5_9BURK|nr:hypothetical protein [Caballeronia calidae]SAK99819.1 hypothetical protein AWB78_05832 [Caballeronia calidae]